MSEGLKEKLKWLDPFTYVDLYVMPIVNPSGNKAVETVVYVLFAFLFAYIIYNFVLSTLLGTSTPLVIVYSGSMEPVLYRGDVVILGGAQELNLTEVRVDFPIKNRNIHEYATIGYAKNSRGALRAAALNIGGKEYLLDSKGPIVVYYSSLRRQDIIHRAVLKLKATDGDYLVTFGDNNTRIDQDCAPDRDCIALSPVSAKDVKGKYLFHIPIIGYLKLLIFDDIPKLLFG